MFFLQTSSNRTNVFLPRLRCSSETINITIPCSIWVSGFSPKAWNYSFVSFAAALLPKGTQHKFMKSAGAIVIQSRMIDSKLWLFDREG